MFFPFFYHDWFYFMFLLFCVEDDQANVGCVEIVS
jgi:hypothetical protein